MKNSIITKFQRHNLDCGSTEVQIALLTQRVNQLTNHLKVNKKDFASRRGLLKVLGQRKRLLIYLFNKNKNIYYSIIYKLNIRPLKLDIN